jgi:enamine deaminase RidA (YjgF/YER057c/UK114 family)
MMVLDLNDPTLPDEIGLLAVAAAQTAIDAAGSTLDKVVRAHWLYDSVHDESMFWHPDLRTESQGDFDTFLRDRGMQDRYANCLRQLEIWRGAELAALDAVMAAKPDYVAVCSVVDYRDDDDVDFRDDNRDDPADDIEAHLAERRDYIVKERILRTNADDMMTTIEFASVLGISREELLELRNRKHMTVLGLLGADRMYHWPRWQLLDGEPVPGLKQLSDYLGDDHWDIYRFLITPRDELDGQRPIQAIEGGQVHRVLTVAQRLSPGRPR